MTGRDAVEEFVRSRVVDLPVDRKADLEGFEDRWAEEYTDALLHFLDEKGFEVTEPPSVKSNNFWRLQGELFDLYGRDALTPVTIHAISGIIDLATGLVKPEGLDEWLSTPAPSFQDRSIRDCIREHDLDTPLGVLSSLWDGGVS